MPEAAVGPRAWPLVGRDAEIERIGSLLKRPDVSGIVLTGPSGVGKSRLLQACADRAEQLGFVVARVAGSRAAVDLPFGAVAPLLPGGSSGEAVDLFVRARAALQERAGHRPLLLVVDDAHNLDDASALLVHQLAGDLTAFVVCTVRSGEVPPDPVAALWKEGIAERIDLAPLGRHELGRLLGDVLGGPVDPATEEMLWRRSEGNVLHLHELVQGSLDANRFTRGPAGWRLAGDLPVPDRLADVVRLRLEELGAAELDALALVALGEPLALGVAERLAPAELLEGLEDSGWLVAVEDGRRLHVRLAHPLYGDVVRDGLPRLRSRALLRRLADALTATGARRREDALRLAVWRLDGGGDVAPEVLVVASRQARLGGDAVLADRLAELAEQTAPSFDSAYQLGMARSAQGRHGDALTALAGATTRAANPLQEALAVTARAYVSFWGLGDRTAADEALTVATPVLAGTAAGAAVVALHALVDSTAGEPLGCLARAEPVLAGGPGRANSQASAAAAVALTALGRPATGLAVADAALATTPPSAIRDSLLHARLMAMVDLGRAPEAVQEALEGYLRALKEGWLWNRGYFALVAGWAEIHRGRLSDASQWCDEAARAFRASDQPFGLRWALGGKLLAATQRHDLEVARAVATELAGARVAQAPTNYEFNGERGLAWLRWLEGDVDGACADLQDLAARLAAAGRRNPELLVRTDLARLGDARGAAAGIAEVRAAVEGPYLHALAEAVEALAGGGPAMLGSAAEALAALGSDLLAAELAAAAAQTASGAGDQRAATAWARRSQELAARCQGAATPAIAVRSAPVPLSRREREWRRRRSSARRSA
jgi:hypothetical protein